MTARPDGTATAGADVFISYAREDRDTALALATALRAAGLNAWWDRDIPLGRDFTEVITQALDGARMTCVLWSAAAVQSSFVRDEAARARDAGRLLPIRIAPVGLPLGFGTLQTLDLLDWNVDADEPACQHVIGAISQVLAPNHAPRSQATAPVSPAARRRRMPKVALLALAGIALCAALGWGGWRQWQLQTAREHLSDGLQAQFARDPNLEAARTAYLFALEADPDLAPAHYYLGHVYAQLDEPGSAREQFVAALALDGLDADQRREAEALMRTLAADAEPAAIERAANPNTAPPAEVSDLSRLATRVPAPPAQAATVQARVDALFARDAQQRLGAASALALSVGDNSQAVPLAVEQALAGLGRAPNDDAVRSGLNATLALLQAASPMTLSFGRAEIERLLDRAAPLSTALKTATDKVRSRLDGAGKRPPVVFIQIADEAQRPLARALARRFAEAGYDTPGIERVDAARAPSASELRVQGTSHQGLGRWQGKVVQELTDATPALLVLRKADPSVDTYELWLDKDLCVAPTRRVSACNG